MINDVLDVEGIKVEIDGDISEAIIDIANKVFDGVVMRTPVHTGRLRASWDMKVGGVNTPPVSEGGSKFAPLETPQRPVIRLDKPEMVTIANNAEYASAVENGGPNNEPRNMIAATLASL